VFDGQWNNGSIPKLIVFSYRNRKWDVRLSKFAFMDWGLFALQSTKKGDELLSFVGPQYTLSEYKILKKAKPHVKSYVMEVEPNLYIDGDVLKGNVTSFINSSIGGDEIGNVLWEFYMLPKPWSTSKWGYVMTPVARDILVGEDLYTYYYVN